MEGQPIADWERLDLREIANQWAVYLPDCGSASCVFGNGPGERSQYGCCCHELDDRDGDDLFAGTLKLGELVKRLAAEYERLIDRKGQ